MNDRKRLTRLLATGLIALAGAGTAALATTLGDKKCLKSSCGGVSDSACAGTGVCTFCGGDPQIPVQYLCFNAPSSGCSITGEYVSCGKIQVGTCSGGVCSNYSGTSLECTQAKCFADPAP